MAVVACQQLPCNIVQHRMELAGKKKNNQPEVAVAVVAAAVQHHCGSMQRKMELAEIKGKKSTRGGSGSGGMPEAAT